MQSKTNRGQWIVAATAKPEAESRNCKIYAEIDRDRRNPRILSSIRTQLKTDSVVLRPAAAIPPKVLRDSNLQARIKFQGKLSDDICCSDRGGRVSAAPDGFDVTAILTSPPLDPD